MLGRRGLVLLREVLWDGEVEIGGGGESEVLRILYGCRGIII